MENKKTKNVLLAVMGVLTLVGIIVRIVAFQTATVSAIAQLISLLFTALYGFVLYKKPHGNMLKYAMLIFAFSEIMNGSYLLLRGMKYHNILKILAAAAVCYCAGRLNRIDQNKYLMPIIGIVFLVTSVISARIAYLGLPGNYALLLACFNYTVNYLTLMIAYFARYEEHKLAGLMDKPEK